MTGVLRNKHGQIVSDSFTVVGLYRQNPVLASLSCVPKPIEYSLTIRYERMNEELFFIIACMEPRLLYHLVWDLHQSFWPHARFLINHSFFVEYLRGPTHFSRAFCTDLSTLLLQNLDYCEGTLSIYVEDALLQIVPFSKAESIIEIKISNLASPLFKEIPSDMGVFREYAIQPSTWNDGILDVFVKNAQVLSIVFNDSVLFTSNQSSSVDTLSTLHLLSPVGSFTNGVLVIGFKQTHNVIIHTLIHHRKLIHLE